MLNSVCFLLNGRETWTMHEVKSNPVYLVLVQMLNKAFISFSVTLKAQIQWRGEDQNYRQHLHGGHGAERDART